MCTAPHNNGAIPIRRRMREQYESDSDDEEDVIEDVARQYFIYSISVHVASLILHVISRAVDFYTRDLL